MMRQNADAVAEKKCILLLYIDYLYLRNWKKLRSLSGTSLPDGGWM
jgi:hypothetical protein